MGLRCGAEGVVRAGRRPAALFLSPHIGDPEERRDARALPRVARRLHAAVPPHAAPPRVRSAPRLPLHAGGGGDGAQDRPAAAARAAPLGRTLPPAWRITACPRRTARSSASCGTARGLGPDGTVWGLRIPCAAATAAGKGSGSLHPILLPGGRCLRAGNGPHGALARAARRAACRMRCLPIGRSARRCCSCSRMRAIPPPAHRPAAPAACSTASIR